MAIPLIILAVTLIFMYIIKRSIDKDEEKKAKKREEASKRQQMGTDTEWLRIEKARLAQWQAEKAKQEEEERRKREEYYRKGKEFDSIYPVPKGASRLTYEQREAYLKSNKPTFKSDKKS